MPLRVVPCSISEANVFVASHHRHHPPVLGAKFAVAVADGDTVVGVVMVGRPVSRMLDDGYTLEVTRLATDGTKNACFILYATAWRATRAMGYGRLITYILSSESGASLAAAGWRCVAKTKSEGWGRPSRPRIDKHPLQSKMRYEVIDGAAAQ